MNTLKIQIKPFYKNNPFHLKDDQIHILSTNKNEEEIKQLLLQMNCENYSIFIQLELENYNYGYLFIDHKEYELYYYNDFDDYEDEIEFASKNWIKMIKNKLIRFKIISPPYNFSYHTTFFWNCLYFFEKLC